MPAFVPPTTEISSLTGYSLWLGPALTAAIVSGMIQLFIFLLTKKKESKSSELDIKRLYISPIINSCERIIGRYFDIIKREHKYDYKLLDSIKELGSEQKLFSRELTFVFRYIRLFTCITYFDKKRDRFAQFKIVEKFFFYIDSRLRMTFKGNLLKATKNIQLEAQDFIGGKILNRASDKTPEYYDYYQFCNGLDGDDEELNWIVKIIKDYLDVDWNVENYTNQHTSIAMSLIYMIDLFQEIMDIPKWEEIRIFFVSIVKFHSRSINGRKPFLYVPHDLETEDYFDTYNHKYFSSNNSKLAKKYVEYKIRKRGKKDNKIMSKTGFRNIKNLEFKYSMTPKEILTLIKNL